MIVARRKGFLAEMQRQARLAEQRQRAANREQQAAIRQVEQAQRKAERAQIQAARAAEADRKRLEKVAQAAYVASKQAEVEALNIDLAERYAELDELLSATLDVDDFVDLETLRVVPNHPPFQREDLERPIPKPEPLTAPPHPVRREVTAPRGLFGRKRKLEAAKITVEQEYEADYEAWQAEIKALPKRQKALDAAYKLAERDRKKSLAEEKSRYEAECAKREKEADEQNEELDQLIAGLGYGTVDAVQEYVSIVMANSVYPERFPVDHESSFDPTTAELTLRIAIPGPDSVPTTKAFKYTKSTDLISETNLSQKDMKERYASIVHSVALRSIHEIFEADRREIIQIISLELGAKMISPATGLKTYIPFVAVAVDRAPFEELDLSAVIPSATLQHLGAAISKNPFGLAEIDSSGIRRL